jgi:integrase
MKRLLALHDRLWVEANQGPFSFRTLAKYHAALAISILTFAPLRISNLAALEFERTLRLPGRDGVVTVIDIPGPEMKSRQAYSIELPPTITARLRAFRSRLQAEYTHRPCFLFDGGTGRPKLAYSLSWLIQRTLWRHLHLKMTAHQFRHVMGDLVISEEPSASSFETARQLLGHRNLATTTRFYTGQNTIRAGRRHHQLIQKKLDEANSWPARVRRRRGLK